MYTTYGENTILTDKDYVYQGKDLIPIDFLVCEIHEANI